MTFVFGVNIADEACAIPLKAAEEHTVIQDTVGGEPLVLFFDREYSIGRVFSRRLEGDILSFEPNRQPSGHSGLRSGDIEFLGCQGSGRKGPLVRQAARQPAALQSTLLVHLGRLFPETRINDGDAHGDAYKDKGRASSDRSMASANQHLIR